MQASRRAVRDDIPGVLTGAVCEAVRGHLWRTQALSFPEVGRPPALRLRRRCLYRCGLRRRWAQRHCVRRKGVAPQCCSRRGGLRGPAGHPCARGVLAEADGARSTRRVVEARAGPRCEHVSGVLLRAAGEAIRGHLRCGALLNVSRRAAQLLAEANGARSTGRVVEAVAGPLCEHVSGVLTRTAGNMVGRLSARPGCRDTRRLRAAAAAPISPGSISGTPRHESRRSRGRPRLLAQAEGRGTARRMMDPRRGPVGDDIASILVRAVGEAVR